MIETSKSKGLSLLEKAKSVVITTKAGALDYGEQEAELAIAWIKGEIRWIQIRKITGRSTASLCNFLAMSIRAAYKLGMIEIKKGGKNNG